MRALRFAWLGVLPFLAGCQSILGDFDVEPGSTSDGGIDAPADVTSPPRHDSGTDAGLDSGSSSPDACVPETNEQICARLGKSCDGIIATDNCGESRTIPTCGSCTAPQTCGAQMPNVCGCTPETDAQFCTAQGKNCGTVVGTDNCGLAKTVQSCGTCMGNQTCGAHVPNVCGDPICQPETDAAFCSRYGKNCGSFTATDNCGSSRTATCGACTAPQTCGAKTPNVCGCVAESDATFCARNGYACGTQTGTDNCGVTRTVASCGGCSGATNTCTSGKCTCNGNAACGAGLSCCTSGCTDVTKDPAHCGSCTNNCGPGGGWSCVNSQCSCPPAGGTSYTDLCSDGKTCVIIENDTNCTKCGDTCTGGTICSAPPGAGWQCCTPSATCQ